MERAQAEAILDGERETAVALLMRVGELIEANRRLEARVAELEQRLNRSLRNSSLPPSQDPSSAPPRPQQAGSGRRPGGQPGHPGRNRPLLPLEQVDGVIEHWPKCCHACARHFGEEERIDVAAPQRQQVSELPAIAVTVSEHRLHRLRCPACAAETRAELPAGLPLGAFGPRLQAAVATLAVRIGSPGRHGRACGRAVWLPARKRNDRRDRPACGRGAGRAAGAAGSACWLRAGGHIDETGWRLQGGTRTLWGALTPVAALFRVAPNRHEREAKTLLGEGFAGIACSDRWWAYNYLAPERRQVCWSHLIRDFTAHSEGLEPEQSFGQAGLAIAARLFAAWDDFQANGDRAQLLQRVGLRRLRLHRLIRRLPRSNTYVLTPEGIRVAVFYRKLEIGCCARCWPQTSRLPRSRCAAPPRPLEHAVSNYALNARLGAAA